MRAWSSSQAYCQRLTRRARSSFPLAFRLLSRPKRDAMTALYAFLRRTDDLADEPGEPTTLRVRLSHWRTQLDAALAGSPSHRVHVALVSAVQSYGLSPTHLHDVLDGVDSDLEPVAFKSFDQLYPYCYRVASAVGLLCVPIWGVRGDYTAPAESAGIAFQLTNILRDLGEDLARGRVYLPQDEWTRFGSPPESWHLREPAFRELMRFQVDRARQYYQLAEGLVPLLTPEGRAVFGMMTGVYRGLLDEIVRRDYDVFTRRVRIGSFAKLRHFLAAWPRRWGLT